MKNKCEKCGQIVFLSSEGVGGHLCHPPEVGLDVDKQKIKSEFAVFFATIEENLPKTRAMAELGYESIYQAVYPAFIEIRKAILQQFGEKIIELIEVKRPEPPYPNASNGYNNQLDDEEKIEDGVLSDITQIIKEIIKP